MSPRTAPLFKFLLLLFCGTVGSSMIIPYMGFFLVEGLGHQPWMIGVYSLLSISLTLLANRSFARRIDEGLRVFPLVGIAATGFLVAALSLSLAPTLPTVLTLGVAGFGIGSSAVSTMFSLGGNLAERHGIPRSRFNAYMRATTSTAWMIGPAVTFLIADRFGTDAVFNAAFATAIVWVALWWLTLPRDITARPAPRPDGAPPTLPDVNGMWLAAVFIFCLSLAHSLTFSSLPLFYVQEVGLPGFAPGVAFSVKTFVEVIAIFSTPAIIARFGLRTALLGTTLLAVVTIQILASVQTFPQMLFGAALEGLYYGLYASLGISYVQSFAPERPAYATSVYWNTLIVTGVVAGPVVGLVAQVYDFQTVIRVASVVALTAGGVLMWNRRPTDGAT